MYFCMACNLIETFWFRCYVFVIVCHYLLCMCDIVFKAQQDHCPAARPLTGHRRLHCAVCRLLTPRSSRMPTCHKCDKLHDTRRLVYVGVRGFCGGSVRFLCFVCMFQWKSYWCLCCSNDFQISPVCDGSVWPFSKTKIRAMRIR